MIRDVLGRRRLLAGAGILLIATAGCSGRGHPPLHPAPAPLGALSDPIFNNQVANAARSDFVVYEHEFQGDTEWLNTAGEDHVKQIAYRLLSGQDALVLVERSMSSARPGTRFPYPVHPDPDLDRRRREILVRALLAMGVTDADERVVVAPALAPGLTAGEAVSAYRAGIGGAAARPGDRFGGGARGAGGF